MEGELPKLLCRESRKTTWVASRVRLVSSCYQDQDELTAVSRSQQLHDYIKAGSEGSANGLIQNSEPEESN